MQEYLVKVSTSNWTYNNEWDHSSSSDEAVALVTSPNPVGLAKLVANVDELNVLMNMFGREDLSELISTFGGMLQWQEMCFLASHDTPASADIEEYLFSREYSEWVERKKTVAESKVLDEHRLGIRQQLEKVSSGYEAMLAIALENGVTAVSKEAYDVAHQAVETDFRSWHKYRAMSAEEQAKELDTYTILRWLCQLGNTVSFASEEAREILLFWKKEQSTNPKKAENENDDEYSEHRDITIVPFQFPKNGVLLLSSSRAQSYYCD